MAINGLLLPVVLFVLFADCSTEQACKDIKSDLKHNWQLRPRKLQLRCVLYDLTLKMLIFSPNETEIGECVFVPEVDCTLALGIRNDAFSIKFKNCTPPELHVEVNGELVDGLEGNWTCRWGIDANSRCRISSTQVISPIPPQPPQKELRQEDTDMGAVIAITASVTAFLILVVLGVIYAVIINRKKKQAQQPTSTVLERHEAAVKEMEDLDNKEEKEEMLGPVQDSDV